MWETIWHLLEHLAGMDGDVKAQKVLAAARAAADEADRAAAEAGRAATEALNAAEAAKVTENP